jgi:hypothetical protein
MRTTNRKAHINMQISSHTPRIDRTQASPPKSESENHDNSAPVGDHFTRSESDKYGWDPSHFTGNGKPTAEATPREIRNMRMFWRA